MHIFEPKSARELLSTVVGIVCGIGVIAAVTYLAGYPWLIAPFGASALLLYSVPGSPLAQPRNLFGGHLIAGVVGVTCYQLMGDTWYSVTLSVTVAIVLMFLTGTSHPPGGATAIVSVLGHYDYRFLLFPLLAGVIWMFAVACITNKISGERQYPAQRGS